MTKRKDNLNESLQRWGATAVPFSDTTGLFMTPGIEEALERLDEIAALRSTMVLHGDNGVGKSLVIRHWLSTLESKRFRGVAITHASMPGTGIIATLLQKLGSPVSFQRSRNLATLEEAVMRLERQIPVVVLDEAQLYTADALEEVRLLLGLSLPAQPLFALILIGDNYLLDSLRLQNRRALYSRIACTVELTGLKPVEIPAYIAHQFTAVGIDRPCFDDAALQLLIAVAEGVPRTLNLVARAAWLMAAAAHCDMIGPDHLRAAIRRVPGARDKLDPE